jgi:hypothetical protein
MKADCGIALAMKAVRRHLGWMVTPMIAGWLASENGAMTRDHATEASAGAAWTQRDGSTEQGTAERGITQTAVGRHPLGY